MGNYRQINHCSTSFSSFGGAAKTRSHGSPDKPLA
jgi:hypothetical protein